MADLAASDVTVTVSALDVQRLGRRTMSKGSMAFGDSSKTYPYGGIPVPAKQYWGMNKEVTSIDIVDDSQFGYIYRYDETNNKIKVFAPAPPIVIEEAVTVTTNVGTLKYPAAFIMYVSTGNASYKVIPTGLTPVTGSVAVSTFAEGVRPTLTFLAGDSVTSCKVTYVTQAWKEVFDNLVYAKITAGARVTGHADLTFTAGTPDTLDLGELAVAIQTIMWDDNGTYKPCKALYLGVDPATTECAVDFSNATSSETRCSFREEDTLDASTDSVYVTYIKKPASGFLFDRFVEEDDLTPSTDVCTLSSGKFISNALIFGTAGDIPGNTAKYANLISSTEAVGTTATLIQPTTILNSANTFTLGSDHADTDHVKPSYICGNLSEIAPTLLELPDGTVIDSTTLQVMTWGK